MCTFHHCNTTRTARKSDVPEVVKLELKLFIFCRTERCNWACPGGKYLAWVGWCTSQDRAHSVAQHYKAYSGILAVTVTPLPPSQDTANHRDCMRKARGCLQFISLCRTQSPASKLCARQLGNRFLTAHEEEMCVLIYHIVPGTIYPYRKFPDIFLLFPT